MKIKTLLVAGVVLAAGAVSAMAQGTVYSVNAVGFVNIVSPPGFSLISNPLNAATNTVDALFPNGPEGASVFKFNRSSGGFISASYSFGSWDNPALTLVPGEGFFFKNPNVASLTNTFVGNVQQGTLNTSLGQGFTLVSSQVPQSGLVSTDLALPIGEGDSVFTFNTTTRSYNSASFTFGSWDTEPTIQVGQGFFVKKVAATTWTRTFSVNQ